MKRKVIFVHGRSQERRDPGSLKRLWIDALNEGFSQAQVQFRLSDGDARITYYGDTLADHLLGDREVADVIIKGTRSPRPDEEPAALILREWVSAAQMKLQISDSEVAKEFNAPVIERGSPLNWGWVQATLRVVDRYVPGSSIVIQTVTYDVYHYLRNFSIQNKLDSELRQVFTSGEEYIIIGHSLGSIVSYRVLHQESAAGSLKVPLFITLGSPLSIRGIRQYLEPVAHPPCAAKWFNARDPNDVIALYPLDNDNFPVRPDIENKNDVQNDTDNHHGITGYLKDPEVARQIYAAFNVP